jgi:plasmid stabilization system protein ParE
MKRRLRVSREAEAEIDEAIGWYEREVRGLGRRFREAVGETLLQAAEHPELGSTVPYVADVDVRRQIVKKFPYAVVYYETGDEIRVLAVAHGRKRPGYWSGRA